MWQFILSGLSIENKRSIFEYVILRRGLTQLFDPFYYFATQCLLVYCTKKMLNFYEILVHFAHSSLLLAFIGEAGMFV